MTAIQEAADAEFPGVSNVYVDRLGRICFHGRLAKFSPAEVARQRGLEQLGLHRMDGRRRRRRRTRTAPTRPPRSDGSRSTVACPKSSTRRWRPRSTSPTPPSKASTSKTPPPSPSTASVPGRRSSLITKTGLLDDPPATDLVETKRFATYYVQNYAQPRNRITEIGFRSMHPDWDGAIRNLEPPLPASTSPTASKSRSTRPAAAASPAKRSSSKASTKPARPLNPDYDDIELTLDLSPRALLHRKPLGRIVPVQNKPIIHARDHEHRRRRPDPRPAPQSRRRPSKRSSSPPPPAPTTNSTKPPATGPTRPTTATPPTSTRRRQPPPAASTPTTTKTTTRCASPSTAPTPTPAAPASHIGAGTTATCSASPAPPRSPSPPGSSSSSPTTRAVQHGRLRQRHRLAASARRLGAVRPLRARPAARRRRLALYPPHRHSAPSHKTHRAGTARQPATGCGSPAPTTAQPEAVRRRQPSPATDATADPPPPAAPTTVPARRLRDRGRHRRHLAGLRRRARQRRRLEPGAHRRRGRRDRRRRRRRRRRRSRRHRPDHRRTDLGATRHRGRTRRRRPRRKPADSPGGAFTGTPDKRRGWHYPAHCEYVVLYDSHPGRFDVPPRKWTRVPFNTVRIQRTWELDRSTATSPTAWLDRRPRPDRTRQKRDCCSSPPGCCSTSSGSPAGSRSNTRGSTGHGYPNYAADRSPRQLHRAARMTNITKGQVLRRGDPGIWGELRAFVDWPFSTSRRTPAATTPPTTTPTRSTRLGRPATKQTLAVPESHQRRLARLLQRLRRQPRLRPRPSARPNATPPPATRSACRPGRTRPGCSGSAPTNTRPTPRTTMWSSGGNALPSSSTTTTTPTPIDHDTGVLL